ncbi:hypothetical protein KAR91_10505 [Candidatus Pacearchaeota archaeon]|nr:hypothetical protein [Candidatus Pacearchaeota archaeon]
MARYDIKSDVVNEVALNGAVISSDTTTAGVIIDLSEYNSIEFILKVDAYTLGDVQVLIEDGEDASLADAAAVSDTFLSGTEVSTNLSAANSVASIGYVGKKRYVRLSAVTDNSANLYVSAISVKGHGNVPTA